MYTQVTIAECLKQILNPDLPFRIFFCVREIGKTSFRIGHDRGTPYHLLYLPEVGDLELECNGSIRQIQVGELLWIQPDAVFELRGPAAPAKINISVCRFDMDLHKPVGLQEPYVIGQVKPRELLLNDLLPGNRVEADVEALRARAVIAHIIGNAFLPREIIDDHQQTGGLNNLLRKRCMEYIQAHIHQRILIAEVANHIGLNPDYFARQFKKSFGVSPQTWIKSVRIREAADHLLSGTNSISEIADRFGFNNVYFFSRQFREVMGISPRKWLQSQQET